ncbi:cysteine desulfurase family protein [Nanoarchaeota archaeon]
MTKKIYLDNGATTKLDPKVVEAMQPYLSEKYGNPSSVHSKGFEAKEALENSRAQIAKTLNADPKEIIFTSGGTESNNFALKGIAFANKTKGNHIITTKIEHPSILEICKWLETQSFEVTYLDVDKDGFVSSEELDKAITDKTILVSIIHGNNEIGTIQNIDALGEVCKKHGVLFHIDACQSYTKSEIDVSKQNIDLITLNAHKIHGPKGIGALYIRKNTKIDAWQHGGGHEFGKRGGTENIPAIVGFAEAAKIAFEDKEKKIQQITKLRNKLIDGVLKLPDAKLNGPKENRLCFNTNFSFKAIEGESVGGYLDQEGICSSTGSACSEKTLEPSHVLTAIGLSHEEGNGSLRLSLSRFTTEEEIDYTLEKLGEVVKKLRSFSPLSKEAEHVLRKTN